MSIIVEEIDHVNLVVRDMARMIAFYRDAFELRLTKEVLLSGEWIDAVVGLEEVVADVVYLEPPRGARIELIHYRQPVGKYWPGNSLANSAGLRHIAFRVSNIERTINRLQALGIHMDSAVAIAPLTQVSYKDGASKRIVYLHDPEGNLL